MDSPAPSPDPAGGRDSLLVPGEGRPLLPLRLFTWCVAGAVLAVGFLDGALWLLGLVPGRAFVYLGRAALMGLGAAIAWELVVRRERRPERRNPLDWLAFPLAFLLALGLVPLLALSVAPPLEEVLRPEPRVEAYWSVQSGRRELRIWFPRPVARDPPAGNNLRLNATAVPPGYFAASGGRFRWLDGQTLVVDAEAVERDLGTGEIRRVGVNTDLDRLVRGEGARPFRYRDGQRVPAQRVLVRR